MNNKAISDIIYLFADGESTETERALLFEALADDKELQDEFHESVCIRNSALSNISKFTAPAALSNKLFEKAGIDPALTNPADKAIATKRTSLFYKFIIPAVSFIAGALFIIFLNYTGPKGNTEISNRFAKAQSGEIIYDNTIKTNDTKFDNIGTAAKIYRRAKQVKNIQKDIKLIKPAENKAPLAMNENKNANDTNNPGIIKLNENIIEGPENVAVITTENIERPVYTEPVNTGSDHSGNLGLEVCARGIANFLLLPKRNYASGYDYLLNNFALSLDYRLNDRHYLGIEAGQETFDVYVTKSGNPELIKSLLWLGGRYKYEAKALNLFDQITPYTEGVLGWTISGPIGKVRLGLFWQPENIIKMYVGLEATELVYKHIRSIENTTKMSINYGLSVSF